MPRYTTAKRGELSIDTAPTFVDAFNGLYRSSAFPRFHDVFERCGQLVRSEHPKVSDAALSNARGAWYQWLNALAWRDFCAANSTAYDLVKLPNKKACKWHRLYEPGVTGLIDDLEAKIAPDMISLETSNPDFALIELDHAVAPTKSPASISEASLQKIDAAYQGYEGKVPYGRLKAFLSIKTSLRPDRRLQTQFEATMIKAVQAYLATRRWDMDTKVSGFYVLVHNTPSGEDRSSLCALAAHSLVTPLVQPQKLVDDLVQVDDFTTAARFFSSL